MSHDLFAYAAQTAAASTTSSAASQRETLNPERGCLRAREAANPPIMPAAILAVSQSLVVADSAPLAPEAQSKPPVLPAEVKPISRNKFYLLAGGLAILGIAGVAVSGFFGSKYDFSFFDTTNFLMTTAISISLIAGIILFWRKDGWNKNKIAKGSFTLGALLLGAIALYMINGQNFGVGPFTKSIENAFSSHAWQDWTIAGAITLSSVIVGASVLGALKLYLKQREEQEKCQPKKLVHS